MCIIGRIIRVFHKNKNYYLTKEPFIYILSFSFYILFYFSMHKFDYQTKWSDYSRDPKIIAGGIIGFILFVVLLYFIFRGTVPVPLDTMPDRSA